MKKTLLFCVIIALHSICFAQKEVLPYRSSIGGQVVDSALSARQLRIPSFTGQTLNGYEDKIGQSFGINKTNNRLSVRGAGIFLDYPTYTEVASMVSAAGTVKSFSRTNGYGITNTISDPTVNPNITSVLDTLSEDAAVSKSRLASSLNLYGKLSAANTFTANQIMPRLSIGGTNLTSTLLRIDGSLTGGATAQVAQYNGTIQSDVTTSARVFRSAPNSVNSTFTTSSVIGMDIANLSKGASHTVTNQYGVTIADLTAGTNNYALFSSVSSGTGKWNLYMTGTALNYLNGSLLLGTTTDSGDKINANGTVRATQFKISALNTAPGSATATGVLGEVRITATYIYVCTAANTWVRTSLATW